MTVAPPRGPRLDDAPDGRPVGPPRKLLVLRPRPPVHGHQRRARVGEPLGDGPRLARALAQAYLGEDGEGGKEGEGDEPVLLRLGFCQELDQNPPIPLLESIHDISFATS